MKGKRYSEEKIIGILKVHEAGAKVADLDKAMLKDVLAKIPDKAGRAQW